jgi:UPF0716 family protein affecting phage T7 exclusion
MGNHDEQISLYVVIAAIAVIPVVIALWQGGVFGAEPTIGLIMLASATAGLVAMWRAARRARARAKPRD